MPAAAQWGASMGSLISVMLVELGPDLWRKGRVARLIHSKIHDLARGLKRCCIAASSLMSRKVEAQRGRQQCKNKALMSVSRKIRSLRINMTLPLGNKWHSCHADCRAGLAILAREHCKRIWRREKSLLLPVGAEYTIVEWKRWIIWAWNQILWHLNIEMVSLIFWYVESNLCRIEMNNGRACGIRFGNVQIVSFVFSFLRTCPMGVYSINFMRFRCWFCFL